MNNEEAIQYSSSKATLVNHFIVSQTHCSPKLCPSEYFEIDSIWNVDRGLLLYNFYIINSSSIICSFMLINIECC